MKKLLLTGATGFLG
ncbi:putative hemolysin domain protein, partial [Yersinia pestis PY-89]